MDETIPINLRVPRTLKGRWIRASRAENKKLSDWIIDAAEAQIARQLACITIPDSVRFADLQLSRDTDGSVAFDMAPIERICAASNIPIELFLEGPEDNLATLITNWYAAHRAAGGDPDEVQEELIAEVRIEDRSGQPFSYQPGQG